MIVNGYPEKTSSVIVFLSCIMFLSVCNIYGGVTTEYSELRAKGEKMSHEQIVEFRSMVIGFMQSENTNDVEELESLYGFPIIFSAGVNKCGEKFMHKTLSLINDKFTAAINKRGVKEKYDKEDIQDRLFFKKTTLYLPLLDQMLTISFEQKKLNFCLSILEESLEMPIVEVRRVVAHYLLKIYNDKNIDPQDKVKAEKMMKRQIEIEKSVLNDDFDNKDFINTDSVSRGLMEELIAKKREIVPSIIQIP
jgi:hypothetical protein